MVNKKKGRKLVTRTGMAMAELNPGIKGLVLRLQELGYHTTDSGDGVTNVAAGMGCALPFKHVFISCAPFALVKTCDELLCVPDLDGWTIEGMYSPNDGHAIIMVYWHDAPKSEGGV